MERKGVEPPCDSSGETHDRRGSGPKSGPVEAAELIELWEGLDAEGRAELLAVARTLVDQRDVIRK